MLSADIVNLRYATGTARSVEMYLRHVLYSYYVMYVVKNEPIVLRKWRLSRRVESAAPRRPTYSSAFNEPYELIEFILSANELLREDDIFFAPRSYRRNRRERRRRCGPTARKRVGNNNISRTTRRYCVKIRRADVYFIRHNNIM